VKVNIEENEYPLQRDNDKNIMELAEDLGFSSCELRFLNHCRLFLNVISLSDIVNESRRGIDPTVTNLRSYQESKYQTYAFNINLITLNGQYGLYSLT
jgi:hypothetical protein